MKEKMGFVTHSVTGLWYNDRNLKRFAEGYPSFILSFRQDELPCHHGSSGWNGLDVPYNEREGDDENKSGNTKTWKKMQVFSHHANRTGHMRPIVCAFCLWQMKEKPEFVTHFVTRPWYNDRTSKKVWRGAPLGHPVRRTGRGLSRRAKNRSKLTSYIKERRRR